MMTSNVAAILFLCFALGRGDEEIFETKLIDGNSGLYFEETGSVYFYTNEWKIVSNVNLTTYTKEFNDNKNNFEQIMNNCEELKFIEIARNSSKKGSEGCGPILYQLSSLMADIEDNHSKWFPNDGRHKRSIVSELFLENWPEDQVFISEEFKKMAIRMSKTSTVAAKQTTFISSSRSIARHDQTQMSNDYVSNQLSIVSSTLVTVKSGSFNFVRFLQLKTTIHELISYQMHTLTRFSSKQKQLLNILSLVRQKNPIIPIFLPSAIVTSELNQIRNIISERGLDFPMSLTSENLLSFYQVSSTELTMLHHQIFVTYRIPLISKHSDHSFSLLKISSLLYRIRDDLYSFVIPTDEFIAVDTNKVHYTMLTVDDLNNCKHASNMTSIICQQTSPFKNIFSSNECESNILLKRTILSTCNSRLIRHHAEIFIKVLKPNSWLVSFPKQTKIQYMCEGKPTQESFVKTNTTVLLTINSDCKFATDNVLITGENVFTKSEIYQHPNLNNQLYEVPNILSFIPRFIPIPRIQNISQVINIGENEKLLSISCNSKEYTETNFRKIVLLGLILAVLTLFLICYICKIIFKCNGSTKKRKVTKVEIITKAVPVTLNGVKLDNVSEVLFTTAQLAKATTNAEDVKVEFNGVKVESALNLSATAKPSAPLISA